MDFWNANTMSDVYHTKKWKFWIQKICQSSVKIEIKK
jgi:hypothetical protein